MAQVFWFMAYNGKYNLRLTSKQYAILRENYSIAMSQVGKSHSYEINMSKGRPGNIWIQKRQGSFLTLP